MKTIKQISQSTNVPPGTIKSAILAGRLSAQKIGTDWLIDEEGEAWKKFKANYRPKKKKLV